MRVSYKDRSIKARQNGAKAGHALALGVYTPLKYARLVLFYHAKIVSEGRLEPTRTCLGSHTLFCL
eukprot:c38484_g1_i1 orf=131-328(+)